MLNIGCVSIVMSGLRWVGVLAIDRPRFHSHASSSGGEVQALASRQESLACESQPFGSLPSGTSSSGPSLEELFVAASAPLMESDADTTSESSATSEAGSMTSRTDSVNAGEHSNTQSKAVKTPRRSHRHQVRELQHEIERLLHQVESLRADQLLGASLEQFLSPTRHRPNYRLLAAEAKQAAELAQADNVRLKLRVHERMTQIRSVRRLLVKQFAIAKIHQLSALDPPRSTLFTSQDADRRIYSMLCSNLDLRCAQFGSVLAQCASVAAPTELSQVVLHADGAGVDFKTSRVLPFTPEGVCRALYKAVNVDSALDSDLFVQRKAAVPQAHGITKRNATTGQSVLRRMTESNRIVLVWESFETWLPRSDTATATGSSSRERWPAIHGASWAVIEPLPELGERACFLQTVTSIRMKERERNGLGHQEIGLVLQFIEQFILQQRRLVGQLLLDTSLKPDGTQ